MIGVIGGIIITGDDAGKGIAQHLREHLGAAAGGNDKQDGQGGDEGPEVTPVAF